MAAAATLIRRATSRHLTLGSLGAYALTPVAWHDIIQYASAVSGTLASSPAGMARSSVSTGGDGHGHHEQPAHPQSAG